MVNGPACPNDGAPLRWVPEQNAWGCDRCRSMFPASGPVAQPQQPQYTPAQPGGFGGSARTPSTPPGKWQSPPSQPGYAPPAAAGFGGSASQAGTGTNPAMPNYKSNPPSAPAAYAPAGGAFGGSAASSGPPRAHSPSQPNMAAWAPPGGGINAGYGQPQQAYGQPPAQPGYGQASGFPPAQPAPQQPAYPQQYPQQPQYPQGVPAQSVATEKKGGKGLLIGIIAVVAIGIGITVAVLVTRGGKKGGVASSDDVFKDALAAVGNNDVDKLMALAPSDGASWMECDDKGKGDQEAGKKLMREMFQKRIDDSKGITAELVKLADDKTTTLKKGEDSGSHCKLTQDMTMHTAQATFKLTSGSRTKEKKVSVTTLEVDGAFYLVEVPPLDLPRDCPEAARVTVTNAKDVFAKAGVVGSGMARLQKAVEQHCNDDVWPDEAVDCMIKSKSDPESERCLKMMTQSQQDKVINHMGTIIAEYQKSTTTPPPGDVPTVKPPVDPGDVTTPPSAGSGAGSGSAGDSGVPDEIPPICNDYKEQIDKLAACRRVTPTIKKGFKESYAALEKAWSSVKHSQVMYESTERACKVGVDGVLELRKTYCR